jgi:hypothetical protein
VTFDRTVPRDAILAAFRGYGVSVKEVHDERGRVLVTFVRGTSAVEVQVLPDQVPLRIVLRLAAKFGVSAHHFLAPGEFPSDPDDILPSQ